MIAYILGLLAGVATPTQASVNGSLRAKIKSPYLATTISFGTAMLWMFIIVFFIEGSLAIPFNNAAGQPWWIWAGGPCGLVIVLSNVVCLPPLGSAVNIMLLSFGQIMTGLIIDNWGLFGTSVIPMTVTRAVGALFVIVGVVFTVKEPHKDGTKHSYPFLYMLFAVVGGVCCALQVAINGTLATVLESSWFGTLVNMICGTLSCLICILIIIAFKGKNGIFDKDAKVIEGPYKWYMFMGGACAVIIVGSNAITAPILGTGIVTVLNLIGQMSTSLGIDAIGFLGIEKKPITKLKIIGIVTMIIGTGVIMLV